MPNNNCIVQSTFKLVQHFFRGSLRFSLHTNDIKAMNLEWQQTFLDATFHTKLHKKYPLNNEFVKLFLKKIIAELEPSQEIHDDLYTELCKVMNGDDQIKDGFSYRHYVICDDIENIVTIRETNNMVVNGTTGMRTWEAAFLLADWALTNKDILSNKNILELGSGVGFTGIAIEKMCNIQSYILTDCHHEVLNTISDNIEINFPSYIQEKTFNITYYKNVQNYLGVMMLDWNEIEDIPSDIIPDIIFGADIVYDPSIIESLILVIEYFCNRNKNIEIYIAGVIRNEETFELFLKQLNAKMFLYQKIELTRSTFVEWDCQMNTCLLKIKQ